MMATSNFCKKLLLIYLMLLCNIITIQEIIDVRAMLTDAIRGASNDIMTNSASDRLVKPLGNIVRYFSFCMNYKVLFV